jgi:hypothetical protein
MTSSARVSRALLAAAALALAGTIAGCSGAAPSSSSAIGSGASSSSSSAPAASTPADSGGSSSSAPGVSVPAATPSPSQGGGGPTSGAGNPNAASSPGNPGPQPCSSRYLRADPGTAEGAAGSLYLTIKFVNLNKVPCTLYGYPGVSLGAGTPVTQVGAAADRAPGSAKSVVLVQPRGVASALLRITQALNYPSANCGPVSTSWIQVFPPGQTAPLYMSYKSTGCAKDSVHLLTIDVVKAGPGA